MEFGFVTDELSIDPREAIEIALPWGVRKFEIRQVHGKRFPNLDDDVLDELAALREEYDIEYTAVSPGFFKARLEDEAHIAYALGEGLERCMDFMEGCEVPLLICFSFELGAGADEQAVERLQELADRLDERRLSAAIENETDCKANTPERIAALLDQVNRPNMGANWDLGNLKEGAQDGFPNGYETVKPHIVNVHAKDVVLESNGLTRWTPIGEGLCDWPGQMQALARDAVVGHITIESHCGPAVEVGRKNLDILKRYLQR